MSDESRGDADRTIALDRRRLLTGAGALGLAGVLGGCADAEPVGSGTTTTPDSAGTPSGNGGGPGKDGAAGGDFVSRTGEIPEGGGRVFADQGVVVTQPTAGDFKAFSATCTHQACKVSSVSDGTINCPCHGSKFSILDGSVKAGPASSPLPSADIVIEGEQITLG